MPVSTAPPTRTRGLINFSVPDSRLPDEPFRYARDAALSKPYEAYWVPLYSLRNPGGEDMFSQATARQSLHTKGFAVVNHVSTVLEERGKGALETDEGMKAYLEEARAFIKEVLGAEDAIVWNKQLRRNTSTTSLNPSPLQQKADQAYQANADSYRNPPASAAHVDQTPGAAWSIFRRGLSHLGQFEEVMGKWARVSVVNLWRPTVPKVTNSPLALADFRTIDPKVDLGIHASIYGQGYDIHHNTNQRWNYVPYQTPSEALLIKCFDSLQNPSQTALFGAHTAVDALEFEEPLADGEETVPRESIEVRFLVLWELRKDGDDRPLLPPRLKGLEQSRTLGFEELVDSND